MIWVVVKLLSNGDDDNNLAFLEFSQPIDFISAEGET
jgi:hypothetical protein